MNYRELKELEVVTIQSSSMMDLVKKSLSIPSNSTYKDDEILMLINGALRDLERQKIDVEHNMDNGLIQGAICMYVKANFGMVDEREKEISQKNYDRACTNLSLSAEYKMAAETTQGG